MSTKDIDDVMAAEKVRAQALIDSDGASLERLLAGNYRYVHASGRVESRESYIGSIAAGKNKFLRFDRDDVVVDVRDKTAIASGALRITLKKDDAEDVKKFRYVSVWAKDGAAWQLSYWQSTTDPTQ